MSREMVAIARNEGRQEPAEKFLPVGTVVS